MRYFVSILLITGCGSSADTPDTNDTSISEVSPDTDTSISEVSPDTDTSISEVSPDTDTTEDVDDDAGATTYCERSVEMFCGYYQRCGRMVAASMDECRRVFLETCNARYEPLYADLEARGDLYLSVAGLARCAQYLDTVACDQQIFDLDGCPDVWVGRHQVGEPCGPGLESFVCAENSVCVIGLTFCGTCHAKVESGCDLDLRCDDNHICSDGTCVPRGAVGSACTTDGPPCVLGAGCVDGTCEGPEIVGEGESCGGNRRCPYRSQCSSGICVRTELAGESCGGSVGCASGACVERECRALGAAGESCSAGSQCISSRCTDGLCEAVRWSCVP